MSDNDCARKHEVAALRRELRTLTTEVRAVRSEIACLRVPRLPAADYAALEILLPAIRAAVGLRVFSLRELLNHAELPTVEARALRGVLGTLDARRLGKLFARALGVHVGGLLVQHVGTDRDGANWMIGASFAAEKDTPERDTAMEPVSNGGTVTNRK